MKFLLILIFTPILLFSQITSDYIKENAIPIQSLDTLNDKIYNQIKDFELIMIGEMHGTWEPAQLLKGLASEILRNENRVSVGIEIPEDEMKTFIDNPNDSTLLASKFFTRNSSDGRNGDSWFSLIQFCYKNSKIDLFFYDNFIKLIIEKNKQDYITENIQEEEEYRSISDERDKGMYISLLTEKKKYPNNKIITLSGNLHNWLTPRNENRKMGSYCYNDTVNFNKDKICSIRHLYSEGTMLNSLGFKTIEYKESIYTESIDSEKYILFHENGEAMPYNCTLYTRKVTHSSKIAKND